MPENKDKFDAPMVARFLENVVERDWFHLYSSNPAAAARGKFKGYVAHSVDDALYWLQREAERKQNLYFAMNTPTRTQTKKAKRHELRWLFGQHVDVDLPDAIARQTPEAERWIDETIDRLLKYPDIPGKPHVVMSGNGVQGFWMFDDPIRASKENCDALEAVNKRLIEAFGAPSGTHDATRVLRIPGTLNYPGKAKLERNFKPVWAELTYVSRDTFTMADFSKLPTPKGGAAVIGEVARRDWTAVAYDAGWRVYTASEFLRKYPSIDLDVKNCMDRHNGDRSPGCFTLMQAIAEFLWDSERVDAADLVDDHNAKRNVMEIALGVAESDDAPAVTRAFGHYYDKGDEWLRQLGYETGRLLATAATENRGWRERRENNRESAAFVAAKPEDEIEDHEARRQFIQFVELAVDKNSLPNLVQDREGPSRKQPITEANLRDILRQAGIEASWNAMTDHAHFTIRPDAAAPGHAPGRALAYWKRAMAAVHADRRSDAETSLVLDALATFGMLARGDIPSMLNDIAKDRRFHPIEAYCTVRPWDGTPRIVKVASCLDSDHPLKYVYIRNFFRQCVAVVKSLDHYLRTGDGLQISGAVVLDGHQNIGKSAFWRTVTPQGFMANGAALHLGMHNEADSKRACLSGMVCSLNEIGSSLARSQADALKDFQTTTKDDFRVAYGRTPVCKPRMTVFTGTANGFFHQDHTGSRRFLVIEVRKIDFAALAKIDLQQVYAEAWHEVMEQGAQWWLTDEEDVLRARMNEPHRAPSEDELALENYFAGVGDQHQNYWLTAMQVHVLLNIRYIPARWPRLRQMLADHGCEYRQLLRQKHGHDLRKVFSVPVLPERYQLLTAQ